MVYIPGLSMGEHGTIQGRTGCCPDGSVLSRRSDVFSLLSRQTWTVFLLTAEKPLRQGCPEGHFQPVCVWRESPEAARDRVLPCRNIHAHILHIQKHRPMPCHALKGSCF